MLLMLIAAEKQVLNPVFIETSHVMRKRVARWRSGFKFCNTGRTVIYMAVC
jgi:hypothetical protein